MITWCAQLVRRLLRRPAAPQEIETDVADLRDVPLRLVRLHPDVFNQYTEAALKQVERPRINLGSGPPGRAD